MIRIREIFLPFDHNQQALQFAVAQRLGIEPNDLNSLKVVRRSIDARHHGRIYFVYIIDVCVGNESEILAKISEDDKISIAPEIEYNILKKMRSLRARPVIVGSGPSGLFAGLILAEAGTNPILLERGKEVEKRVKDVYRFWRDGVLDVESNAVFGEGGAGTFSDGKLTTQIKDKRGRIRKVLEEFVAAGAPEEILWQAKGHIGTDKLVGVVKKLREKIISLGGELRFDSKVTGLILNLDKIEGVIVNGNEEILSDKVVLALGHSARDTFEMLVQSGIAMQSKGFSIGVRIEHPQSLIDKTRYGRFAGDVRLGRTEYKLVSHVGGRVAYTFCMCPGGEVIGCSSEAGQIVTNGMSVYARNRANANSALLVNLEPEEFGNSVLAGVEFQRKWESKAFEAGGGNYFAPVQLVGDFLAGRVSKGFGNVMPSYTPGTKFCDLRECLPELVAETLKKALPDMGLKMRGFDMADAVMTGVETRSSSPVRIIRNEKFESVSHRGLYPCGEGAGYAGGIMSAAVDGLKIAEAICQE